MIERAVILAAGKALNFDLPGGQTPPTGQGPPAVSSSRPGAESIANADFLTEAEMRQCERDNMVKVLEKADWKIKGQMGAAELLGIHPATLVSRLRKLKLRRPKH